MTVKIVKTIKKLRVTENSSCILFFGEFILVDCMKIRGGSSNVYERDTLNNILINTYYRHIIKFKYVTVKYNILYKFQ